MDRAAADILSELKRLESVRVSPGRVKTSEVRGVSGRSFRALSDKSRDSVLTICDDLLAERSWAAGVVAYDFAYRVRRTYDVGVFDTFERWLRDYVRGWGDCDDFCTHAFGELIYQYPELFGKIVGWTKRGEFWMRRAGAVVLLPTIWREKYREIEPFLISGLLMKDGHDLVRKGYGWMLKELSKKEPALVFDYLMKNRDVMPRVAFRYACEKMPPERRQILMEK